MWQNRVLVLQGPTQWCHKHGTVVKCLVKAPVWPSHSDRLTGRAWGSRVIHWLLGAVSAWKLLSVFRGGFRWDLRADWQGAGSRRDGSQPFGVPGKPDPLRRRRHAAAVHSSFRLHFSQLKYSPGTSIHSHTSPLAFPSLPRFQSRFWTLWKCNCTFVRDTFPHLLPLLIPFRERDSQTPSQELRAHVLPIPPMWGICFLRQLPLVSMIMHC